MLQKDFYSFTCALWNEGGKVRKITRRWEKARRVLDYGIVKIMCSLEGD